VRGRTPEDTRSSVLISLGAFTAYVVYSLSTHAQFLTAGYDLGIFDQAVRHYSHFEAPLVTLKGEHFNLLGDHFHPILALLAPLYWIWDDARMLLLAQAALLALSVAVVHRFAVRHFTVAAARWLAVAYALGWPLQAMLDFNVHEVAFAVPLLALALDALDRRAVRSFLVSSLLLLGVREDMGILVVLLGVVWVACARPRWPGLVLIGVGPVAYVVTTAWILPGLAPDGAFAYWSYDALGPDLPSALGHIVLHPLSSAALLITPTVKLTTLLWLLAPLLFVSLRSPLVLVALPLLAQNFFSSREHLWPPDFHYWAPIWPIVFLAGMDGLRRLQPRPWPRVTRAWIAWAVAFPVVGTCLVMEVFPFQRLLDGAAFRQTGHMRDQAAVLAAIPPGTCVYADDRLAGQLTHSNHVSLPGLIDTPPDFVALDLTQPTVGHELPTPEQVLADSRRAGFEIVLQSGDLVLLRAPDYHGPTPGCSP